MENGSTLAGCLARNRSRHRLGFGLAIVSALAGLIPSAAPAASFTASLDRDTVVAGESAVLTLTFEGGQPKSFPALPSIPNLQIADHGTSQNISGVNGRWTSTISETLELTPVQPGDYVIPALKADVDGQLLTSRALTLKAVKPEASASAQSGEQLAFLRMLVPKKEVYLGEAIQVQLQLYIRDGVANGDGILRGFEGLGSSPLKADGFSILKAAYAQRQRTAIGAGIYDVATLVTLLSPVKTGPLTIDSINTSLILQVPATNQRRDNFDPFGMFQRFQEKRAVLATDAETVTVLPLPPGAPANFNGAVGSYHLALTAGPTNVAAGDPITVRIQLSGSGVLDSLALPEQTAWHDFKVSSPTYKIEPADPLGATGTKTFETVVVPQSPDIRDLPPVSFSYFDSTKRSYETLTGSSIALSIRPGGAAVVPAGAAANRAVSDNPPPSPDLVYIKQRLGEVAPFGPPLVQQPWFLALQGTPVFAWLSVMVWRKRSDRLANNPRLRRQRRVAQILRDGLMDLRKAAAENNPDEFFAALFRLLQEQLGERLDLPASAITEAVIEEHLRPSGVPEPALSALHELFQTCNLARYAPVKTSQELAAMIPKFEAVLRELRDLKR